MKSHIDNKLVESIYNIAVNPQKYDDFLNLWQEEFLHIPTEKTGDIKEKINIKSQRVGDAIEQHFFRAFTILELMDHKTQNYTIKQIIEADPLPSFIISQDKTILLYNEPVGNLLKLTVGGLLLDLNISPADFKLIDDNIQAIENIEQDKLLSIIQIKTKADSEPLLFALSKINEPITNVSYLRLSGIHTIWNSDIGVIIQNIFSLSDMELDIAKKLVSGMKLSDIATAKERSIFTIRTQKKNLFRKTNLKSQSELIRLFALLQNLEYQDKQYILPTSQAFNNKNNHIKRQNYLIRANGRKLYYEIYGAPRGEPVLFMHGGISGTELPQFVEDILISNNIKLIAPHRAGFGYSEEIPEQNKVEHLLEDILALFDHENINKCKLIGHLVGSFYAYYIASRLADRISKIRIIGGAVPFANIHQINALKPRQRIITYTAKYAPQLLPFLLKGAVAQIKQYGAERFMQALFQDNISDHSFCKMPETRDVIASGLHSSFGQGVGSVVSDAHYIFNGDWHELVKTCETPIEIFHGADDPAVPIDQVEDFLQTHENIKLTIVDGGQMILFKHPELLFKDF